LIREGKIFAVGFGLDLTNRELQSELKAKGLPWERAKAFNGAAVMSQFVSIEESDIPKLSMQLWINGVLVQEGNSDLMIYKPLTVIDEISSFSTLADNDIVMTGTPKGERDYIVCDEVEKKGLFKKVPTPVTLYFNDLMEKNKRGELPKSK
jgi:2-keto-4-pentenoate hydratase/2-oxohepta-3-ene-1,7-dioic acid hydratase in catechol pathway